MRSAGGIVAALSLVLAGAGFWAVEAALVNTTANDFKQPGTQPSTLTHFLIDESDCVGCHGGYDPSIEPHALWKTSIMAQAGRDPLYHAGLAVAQQDADFSGELCIRCHAPYGWLEGRSDPPSGSSLTGDDFDGVQCIVCHRMVDPVYEAGVNPVEDVDVLAQLTTIIPTDPHTGQYVIDHLDRRRGPFDIDGFPHQWLNSTFHQDSLLCANCHDVSNPAYTKQIDGTYELNTLDAEHPSHLKSEEFPMERTYSEWSQSAFAAAPIDMAGRFGGNKTEVSTCQDCHMPDTTGIACIFQLDPRDDMPLHDFRGATTWILDTIRSHDESLTLYDEPSGLTSTEVAGAKARNEQFLRRASDMDLSEDGTDLQVRIYNQTGHKLPTGYPEGRRMWINVKFFDHLDALITEHGAYDFTTAVLTTGDTKVYEAKLGIDADVALATGIPEGETFHFALNNVWLKDNRIPPRGFTNAGFEAVQAAPVAASYVDGQYWDDTDYPIPCDAARAEVTVYYQTASKEYVEFLKNTNTTNGAGQTLYDEWVAAAKGPPVVMDTGTKWFGDCNGNQIRDACDISMGTSNDMNGNGRPDECDFGAEGLRLRTNLGFQN